MNNIKKIICLLVIIMLAACATTSKKVAQGPVYPTPLNKEMNLAYDGAYNLYKAGKDVDAEKGFHDFINNYGYNQLTDHAYFYLGEIALERNDYQTAAAQYEQAYAKTYSPEVAPLAQYKAAYAFAQMSNFEKSQEVISKMVREDMDSSLKLQADSLAIKNAGYMNQTVSQSIKNYLMLYDDYSSYRGDSESLLQLKGLVTKEEAESKIKEWIEDGSVGFKEVEALSPESFSKAGSGAYVFFKLGLAAYKEGDYSAAAENLKGYLNIYPKHEYATRARELLSEVGIDVGVRESTIGVILPLSGEYKIYGESVLKGIECAAGIYKPCSGAGSVKLIVRDSQGDPKKAEEAVHELAAMGDVMAIVGPLLKTTSHAAAVAAESESIPILTISRDEEISHIGNYVFRSFLSATSQIDTLIQYAVQKKGLKNFVVMKPDNDYGAEYSKMFIDKVKAGGGNIVEDYTYKTDEVDFKDEACMVYYGTTKVDIKEPKIKGRSFDAVFIPDSYKRVSYIVPTLRYVGMSADVRLLGTSMWDNYKLIDRAKDYLQGAVFTAGFYKDADDFSTKTFVSSFKEAYSEEPALLEAEGYDATKLVINAINNSGGKHRSSVKDELAATKDFSGVTGRITFDGEGDAKKEVQLLGIFQDKMISLKDLEHLMDLSQPTSTTIELR